MYFKENYDKDIEYVQNKKTGRAKTNEDFDTEEEYF